MLENAIMPSRLSFRYQVLEFSAIIIICTLISGLLYAIFIKQVYPFWIYLLITYGYGLSIYIASLIIQVLKPKWPAIANYALSLGIGVAAGSLWLILGRFFSGRPSGNITALSIGLFFSLLVTSSFFMRTRWVMVSNVLQQERLEKAEQARLLAEAQLTALQAQIEPHFFFNTLATIRSLIDLDSEKAKLMLSSLTDLFRLVMNRQEYNMLGLELDIVERYLSIQAIRLGKRLNYQIHCPQELTNYDFPPLLLQPLVENAIKHGVEPSSDTVNLHVNIKATDHTITHKITDGISEVIPALIISVADTGLGFQPHSSGNGLGIKNVSDRLRHFYGDSASLSVTELETGGVESLLVIPLSALQTVKNDRNSGTAL